MDNSIYQLSARLVSDYLQKEGCKKSLQHFHLESPLKSLFTHTCTECRPPNSLQELLTDYYRLHSIVNHLSNDTIPHCNTSLQLVKSSTSRKRKISRIDQIACIPLQYTNDNNRDSDGKIDDVINQVDRHENSIQYLIHLANMQQKTLQKLVLSSVKQNTSPKKKKLTSKPTKLTDKDEYMTQLIDTILNDQTLLDKLVNYINQSLDTPDDDTDINLQDGLKHSEVAENVIRLTENDPQFGDLFWRNEANDLVD